MECLKQRGKHSQEGQTQSAMWHLVTGNPAKQSVQLTSATSSMLYKEKVAKAKQHHWHQCSLGVSTCSMPHLPRVSIHHETQRNSKPCSIQDRWRKLMLKLLKLDYQQNSSFSISMCSLQPFRPTNDTKLWDRKHDSNLFLYQSIN